MQQTHFTTNNAALAWALFIGGIQPVKIHNEYDDAMLDRLKCPGVETARKLKRMGDLKYYYQDSEDLKRLCVAFDEQASAIDADTPLEMPNLSPDDAVKVACYAIKNRSKFMDLAFLPSVMMYRRSNGELKGVVDQEVEQDGVKIPVKAHAEHPGFSLVSLNLSAEKRQTLNL